MNDMISPTESHMTKLEPLNRAVRIIIRSQVTQPSVNVLLNSLHLNGHTKDFKLYNSYSKIIKATLRKVLLNRRLMNVSTLKRYNLLLEGNKWYHKNERTAFNWVIIDRKNLRKVEFTVSLGMAALTTVDVYEPQAALFPTRTTLRHRETLLYVCCQVLDSLHSLYTTYCM